MPIRAGGSTPNACAERPATSPSTWSMSGMRAGASDPWSERGTLLDGFSRRNTGRRVRLEIDDPALGAQTQQLGWTLLGAAFDPHDRRISLMLGDPAGPTMRHTHAADRVASIAVQTGADGRDVALRIAHGGAQTLLTFLP